MALTYTKEDMDKVNKREVDKEMTYGYCVYHEIECDYKGNCVNCPHNTKEDIEWFKQEEDEEQEESEDTK